VHRAVKVAVNVARVAASEAIAVSVATQTAIAPI
jgi:hypothetical protein